MQLFMFRRRTPRPSCGARPASGFQGFSPLAWTQGTEQPVKRPMGYRERAGNQGKHSFMTGCLCRSVTLRIKLVFLSFVNMIGKLHVKIKGKEREEKGRNHCCLREVTVSLCLYRGLVIGKSYGQQVWHWNVILVTGFVDYVLSSFFVCACCYLTC